MSKLVRQPSFRAVGQTHAKWQAFENLENKRQMYGSQAWVDYLHKVFDDSCSLRGLKGAIIVHVTRRLTLWVCSRIIHGK